MNLKAPFQSQPDPLRPQHVSSRFRLVSCGVFILLLAVGCSRFDVAGREAEVDAATIQAEADAERIVDLEAEVERQRRALAEAVTPEDFAAAQTARLKAEANLGTAREQAIRSARELATAQGSLQAAIDANNAAADSAEDAAGIAAMFPVAAPFAPFIPAIAGALLGFRRRETTVA